MKNHTSKDDRGPRRSKPVHTPTVEHGSRASIIYITVCTKTRRPVLTRSECVDVLLSAWKVADHWLVGRYVIMPDHLHLFCAPGVRNYPPVRKWVEYWKSISASTWPYPEEGKLWQRDCWDRQLRKGERYAEKWDYVRKNPIRAELVSREEDWPWQGELNVLRWHD